MNNDSFFFIKSLDGKRAESFVNKNLLPSIDHSVTNTARLIALKQVLLTDHGYDDETSNYEFINLTFSFVYRIHEYLYGEWVPVKKSILQNETGEQEIVISLICQIPTEDTSDKDIGGYYPEYRAKYIYSWSVSGQARVKDLELKIDDPELLDEIHSFIEVAEVNAYWRYEKKYLDGRNEHFKDINHYYATMYDHISTEPSTDNFCDRCQESPCACSDPDPG